MESIAREYTAPLWITNLMAAWQSRIWLAQDKLGEASQWVPERGLDVDGELPFLREVEYVALGRILIAAPEQTDPSMTQAPEPELVEPLSGRGLEVLQRIAEGLTNQGIASGLYFSPNTVKAHTRNIYGKLGAHNRTQAVARGRALGILPST